MTTDTARLQISVGTNGVGSATRELEKLARGGAQAETATGGLTTSMGGMVARAASAAGAIAGITLSIAQLVSTTREFEKLRAGLTTATGSKELGAEAFEAIKEFATKTPYDLAQVTEAFTKLVNMGLTPSERALYSYGNTASAMGKNMSQMIEAVADATTGEFERLKEFGIKASKDGDQITFRFRGQATTVKNSAKEIEDYLIKLGETNFGEGMKNQMETLDGSLSNLGDAWSQFLAGISEAGAGDVIKEFVDGCVEALNELNAMLASGEMAGYLDALRTAWSGWASDVEGLVNEVTQLWKEHGDKLNGVIDFMTEAFRNFPQNVRAFIQLVVTELAAAVDRAGVYGEALKGYLNPFEDNGNVTARMNARLNAINSTVDASIEAILAERDATVQATQDKVTAARLERAEWERLQAAKREAGGDRLEKFKVKGSGKPEMSDADKKAAEKSKQDFAKLVESLRTEEEAIAISYQLRNNLIVKHTKEGSVMRTDLMRRSEEQYNEELAKLRTEKNKGFEALVSSLQSEEEKIEESYIKRLEIIRNNTEAGSALRERLEQQAAEDREKDEQALRDRAMAPIDAIRQSLMTEEEEIRASYDRRRQIVLDSTLLTETEKNELVASLGKQYTDRMQQLELERNSSLLSTTANLFDQMAGLAQASAGKQSGIYRAMFAVSKAFALADAIVKIQQGIANAAATPFPANLAAMASVASATMGILTTIQGARFSGAYDKGGIIPAGSVGLVGEIGPELVRGPAVVTGREKTAKLQSANDGASNVQVVVYNNSGAKTETRETVDSRGRRRVEVTIGELVSGELQRPGSAAHSAIRGGFGSEPALIRR